MTFLAPSTLPEEMAQGRFWTGKFFSEPDSLPVSFVYGGKTIAGIPADWHPGMKRARLDANLIQTTYEGAHPSGGLQLKVECLQYLDFPVVEWTAWLTNTGSGPTGLISDFLALDGAFAGRAPRLVHCNGDYYNEAGYTPTETALPEGHTLTFTPAGGRPCDQAFPYYRLLFEGCGLALAVGWPGQWSAQFTGLKDGVQIKAGQEKTHLRLFPGETIRSPRMAVLAWVGDEARGINQWRRWVAAHVRPRPDGQPLQPHLANAATDPGEEFTAATEANQIAYMDKFKRAGFDFDVWWIDAGWYPCWNENHERRWWETGTWEPDPERFPHGLRPIAENAAKHGARLLVWFEPERVRPGSWLAREHPEWLLCEKGNTNMLLNLGNPECRRWLTDHINQLIQDNGIGIYRQDFNFEPLRHWRENEPEDRQGLNENLHVQGYLQYWDDLLAANPGLWIDSCSSGGRRNDLETLRRAVPLHYTDYGYGLHPIKLAFHHTLFQWIPYFKECTLSWDVVQPGEDMRFDKQEDSFSYHCGLAGMLFPTPDIRREDYDFAPALQMIAAWRRAAPLLLEGDYYPLTPFSRSPDRWVAWQFDRPETGEGFLQGIRLAECPAETFTARLHGLSTERDYVFENMESGEELEIQGADLAREGFLLKLPPRSGALWIYHSIMKPETASPGVGG